MRSFTGIKVAMRSGSWSGLSGRFLCCQPPPTAYLACFVMEGLAVLYGVSLVSLSTQGMTRRAPSADKERFRVSWMVGNEWYGSDQVLVQYDVRFLMALVQWWTCFNLREGFGPK